SAQRQHQQSPAVALGAAELRPEDQPEEEGYAEQPRHAEDVRDGEDPVRMNTGLLDLHPEPPGKTCRQCLLTLPQRKKALAPGLCCPRARALHVLFGGVLLSHRVPPAVPSAL